MVFPGLPIVNKMDRTGADFFRVVPHDAKSVCTDNTAYPCSFPWESEDSISAALLMLSTHGRLIVFDDEDSYGFTVYEKQLPYPRSSWMLLQESTARECWIAFAD